MALKTMVHIHQVQQENVKQLIGQEQEMLITVLVLHTYTMANIGLVLLTPEAPASRIVSATMVISATAASTRRTKVFAPLSHSNLHSSWNNNQGNQSPPLIKTKRGGDIKI